MAERWARAVTLARVGSLAAAVVASVAALNLVSPGTKIDGKAISIPGKEEPIDVVTFRDVRDLERLLASAPLV